MLKKLKVVLIDLLENHESRMGKIFGWGIVGLIVISIIGIIIEDTLWGQNFLEIINVVENTAIMIFTVEYILRLWISFSRWRFIFSFFGIIDLLVIAPFYIGLFFIQSGVPHIAFLRALRLIRIFRLLKVVEYSDFMESFLKSFRYYRAEFRIFFTTFGLALLTSALGMYALEHGTNPKFETFFSSLWWAMVTMMTVGYGDMVPMTVPGKVVAGLVMFLGIASIAIMTAILTKVFIDHFFGKRLHTCDFCSYPRHDFNAKFCKNCGGKLDVHKLMQAEKTGVRLDE